MGLTMSSSGTPSCIGKHRQSAVITPLEEGRKSGSADHRLGSNGAKLTSLSFSSFGLRPTPPSRLCTNYLGKREALPCPLLEAHCFSRPAPSKQALRCTSQG